ncbi:hypothetical protein HY640_04665 [Candidatus Woesearchaeota archaeon]|nr:hypothetical protein [Candidatus Woesearchaeota archaeon]
MKNLNMKAQIEQSLGITLLIVALLIVLILNSASRSSLFQKEAATALEKTETNLISTATLTSSYATDKGIPVDELLGVYMCYGEKEARYGEALKVDTFSEIRSILDKTYGKDNWLIEMQAKNFEVKEEPLLFIMDSTGSMAGGRSRCHNTVEQSNIQAVQLAANRIVSNPMIVLSGQISTLSQLQCDITPQKYPEIPGSSVQSRQPEENWPGYVMLVAEKGPIDQYGSPLPGGWGNKEKILFISSDELACNIGPTDQYVEKAISKAKEAGIKVYFLMPPKPVPAEEINSCQIKEEDMQEFRQGAERITKETGGEVVEIEDADNLAKRLRQIVKGGGIAKKKAYITSTNIEESHTLPRNRDYRAYEFLFPLPCSKTDQGRYTLYIYK